MPAQLVKCATPPYTRETYAVSDPTELPRIALSFFFGSTITRVRPGVKPAPLTVLSEGSELRMGLHPPPISFERRLLPGRFWSPIRVLCAPFNSPVPQHSPRHASPLPRV